jgi:hypothetical protein
MYAFLLIILSFTARFPEKDGDRSEKTDDLRAWRENQVDVGIRSFAGIGTVPSVR